MEDPHHIAGPDVERADVAGRGRVGFADAHRQDQQVLEDDPGCVGDDVEIGHVAIWFQAVVEVDHTAVAERLDRVSRRGINREQRGPSRAEDPSVVAVGPVRYAAACAASTALGACVERVELPVSRAARRVEREDLQDRRHAVEHPVDDDRAGLDLRLVVCFVAVSGMIGPGDLQPSDVVACDLIEAGVLAATLAQVERPVGVWRAHTPAEPANRQEETEATCVG